jgi:hypothetical protein
LALLGIREGNGPNSFATERSISLEIDPSRMLITDYGAFARALTDQGQYDPRLFNARYETLEGLRIDLT